MEHIYCKHGAKCWVPGVVNPKDSTRTVDGVKLVCVINKNCIDGNYDPNWQQKLT